MWNGKLWPDVAPAVLATVGAAVAAVPATSAAMPSTPAFEPGREIAFYCTVSGSSAIKPVVTPAQVCALFKRRFDAALGRDTRVSAVLPVSANAIRVAVRISGNRSASAAITTTAREKARAGPKCPSM